MEDQPTPGSPEAVEKGCTCPQRDNAHGAGYRPGTPEAPTPLFIIMEGCPLHWTKEGEDDGEV